MRQTIRLGFLGAGAWGRSKHLPALDYIRSVCSDEIDLSLTALCERDTHQSELVAEQYGFERTYDELAGFRSDPEINCYSVVVGPEALLEILVSLTERGIPLLTEKPPGEDVRTAAYLAENVTCPHVVAFNRRYFPIVEQFRAVLDATPDVYLVDCCMTRHGRYDSAVDPGKRHGTVPFVVGTAVHSPHRSLYLRYSMYGSGYPGRIDIHEEGKLVESIGGDAGAHRLVNEGIVGEYRELFSLVDGVGASRSTLNGSLNTMRIADLIEP